jgi:iron complex transport system ATP-binding protein
MTAEPILRAAGVSFSYHSTPALRDVSLDLHAGEFHALAGPNGAGKSTLLNVLTGYLPPSNGTVALGGRDLRRLSPRDIAAQVAVVPQKSGYAFAYGVLEMVLMGRQPYLGLAAYDSDADIGIASAALERVGAGHLAEKSFDELSGGEQQLVLVARALAQDTAVLVLDEPVTFLDLRHQFEIMELLAGLARDGHAILATVHDLNLAARWCSRLALMRCGIVEAAGAPAQVLTQERLRQVYQIPLTVLADSGGRPRVEFPE